VAVTTVNLPSRTTSSSWRTIFRYSSELTKLRGSVKPKHLGQLVIFEIRAVVYTALFYSVSTHKWLSFDLETVYSVHFPVFCQCSYGGGPNASSTDLVVSEVQCSRCDSLLQQEKDCTINSAIASDLPVRSLRSNPGIRDAIRTANGSFRRRGCGRLRDGDKSGHGTFKGYAHGSSGQVSFPRVASWTI
jgi:hypothetical protein